MRRQEGVLDSDVATPKHWALPDLRTLEQASADGHVPRPPTAVIDIGSGSARAVVVQVNGGGVEILAQERLALNLMSHVDEHGALDNEGVDGTLDAIEDFVEVCRGYGVTTLHAVGTEALRASRNAEHIAREAHRRYGVTLRVISGYEEAGYCFIGAVQGLPVTHGLLADLGGGSMEVVGFSDRRMDTRDTLPLGSLRISNAFRLTNRPNADDLASAYDHTLRLLSESALPALSPDDTLVGSGGSFRLLCKLDRQRKPYPMRTLHGYCMDADGLSRLLDELASCDLEERALIPGMNPERTHSIVGGAVVAQALLRHTGASSVMLSGQGLREGLAQQTEPLPEDESVSLSPITDVRWGTLKDMMDRFAPRYTRRGPRRAALARRIGRAVWDGERRHLTALVECAALILDVGSAVDYYNRLNRAASILSWTDMPGFTHRESAMLAAMLLLAEGDELPKRFRNSQLLTGGDRRRLRQAALVLLLADELERRLPPQTEVESVTIALGSGGLEVSTPAWAEASAAALKFRWRSEFGQPILISRGEL
ncbi:MAG: hypothetical protein OYI31_01150 [Chloroflexota bacterium]|nr:hypothetical protein [Chloroflexota bacterium]MDE2941174.1 hypothetical protein [Chloroflexota bacterium]MDE3267053.1 hypothetical protein [Chloroflexota bacterium]